MLMSDQVETELWQDRTEHGTGPDIGVTLTIALATAALMVVGWISLISWLVFRIVEAVWHATVG